MGISACGGIAELCLPRYAPEPLTLAGLLSANGLDRQQMNDMSFETALSGRVDRMLDA